MIVRTEVKDLFLSLTHIQDPFRKQLSICSVITRIFKDNNLRPPVLVGGSVVSVYSGGLYKTVDLDLKSEDVDQYKVIMRELGYTKFGKDFYQKDLDSYVEFPSGEMPDNPDMFTEVTVEETGLPIYLIGVEDIILDRMNSYVATKDQNSREWAARLMASFYSEIDWSYIHKKSHEYLSFKQIERLQRDVKGYLKLYEKMQNDEVSD